MRIQLLSDLHLETERYDPEPAADADLLVLAGDIDATWQAYERFAGWPKPVLVVAGNHEFDGRDLDAAWLGLRERCHRFGLRLLEREGAVVEAGDGRRVRFLGTVRWSDFDLLGPQRFAKSMRAADYFMRLMQTTRHGQPWDALAMRAESLACRDWLAGELRPTREAGEAGDNRIDDVTGDGGSAVDATVVVTHFAPSARSADPRYGLQAATASFCNADDDLIPLADLWLHGHLHCPHDYAVARPGGGTTRVVANPRGHERRGEAEGHRPLLTIEV